MPKSTSATSTFDDKKGNFEVKTHKFDSISFLAGLVITGMGLAFLLLPEVDDIIGLLTDAGSWFWPVMFIAVGIAVLAPLAGRRIQNAPDDTDETESLAS
jgi:hypothetical protein